VLLADGTGAFRTSLEALEVRRLFASLIWNPQTANTDWDFITDNWKDAVTNQQVKFANGDSARCEDPGAGQVNIVGTVAPALTSVHSQFDYNLGGAGVTSGTGVLVKDGGALSLFGSSQCERHRLHPLLRGRPGGTTTFSSPATPRPSPTTTAFPWRKIKRSTATSPSMIRMRMVTR
jgi:hypothetical protein